MAVNFCLMKLAAVIITFTSVFPLPTAASQSLRSRSIGLAQLAAEKAPNGTNGSSSTASSGNSSSGSAANNSEQQVIDGGLVDGQVSTVYWSLIDKTIAAAGLVTPKPKSINDPGPTAAPDPYTAILGTAKTVSSVDTPQASAELDDYSLATPPPPIPQGPPVDNSYQVSVLPYQMKLGAQLMADISEQATPSPLPSQEYVDESFVAQCPMLLFSDNIFISPPCSGSSMGTWSDSSSQRSILRWQPNSKGGLDYSVDSAVSGPGSVKFASLNEMLTWKSNRFELHNCLGVMRYYVEETIMKVEHMAQNAQSTAIDHDVGQSSAAVFYQYLIKHPNGTVLAQSSQYRLPETNINFTSLIPGTLQSTTFAVAKRAGRWQGSEWRDCKIPAKGWNISFPAEKGANLIAMSTVQDLQVAAAAVLTLLAYREENVGSDGFEHSGQGALYWSLFKTVIWVCFLLFSVAAIAVAFQAYGVVKRLKRFFFRLEAVLLPKRPHTTREPNLKAAW